MTTNVTNFIADLDGGVFEEKLSHALSLVASGVVEHNKTGKVKIELDISRIGNSYQVSIGHKLSFMAPTSRGKTSEEDSTQTPMHVGSKGKLTLFPEGQNQLFDKHGNIHAE
ncbi:hypothetical protein [Hahella sp. NBU794]|uniref:hypothetical protein n=1 Tax=Hahella sp. NBU794 TaxID=3422590 RepID=UPI003D6E14FF